MRLEIHHENGHKEVVEFNKDKAVVGSGENSDIVVEGQHIARNQIILEKIDGKIYVTDLDNPNGTYINDNLIEPHKRIEFLSFFPIQIGPKILIYLLPDEDTHHNFFGKEKETEKTTGVNANAPSFSMDELRPKEKTKTNTNRPAPTPSAGKKSAATAAQQKASGKSIALTLMIVAAGISYYLYQMKKDAALEEEKNLSTSDPYVKYSTARSEEKKNLYKSWLKRPKCEEKIEYDLCHATALPFDKDEGVMVEGNSAILFYNLDRATVTKLQEDLVGVAPARRNLYMILKLFTQTELWRRMEEAGLTKLHIINLLVIQNKLTFHSELELTTEEVFSHISLQDAYTALYLMRTKSEQLDTAKLNLDYFKLKEIQ